MKHDPKATANALAVVVVSFSLVCAVLAIWAPDLLLSISQSWTHRLDMSLVWMDKAPDLPTIVWGLITVSATAWVTGYAFAHVYNLFLKKK
ncbi:hypothetical protein HZB96_01660 [Candidatus Gottesmanbacteria bacterium]|nr:hypothetical protein [Candidatus Gottesmanbacteria bacterium]